MSLSGQSAPPLHTRCGHNCPWCKDVDGLHKEDDYMLKFITHLELCSRFMDACVHSIPPPQPMGGRGKTLIFVVDLLHPCKETYSNHLKPGAVARVLIKYKDNNHFKLQQSNRLPDNRFITYWTI